MSTPNSEQKKLINEETSRSSMLPKTSLKYDFRDVKFGGGFAGRDYTVNGDNVGKDKITTNIYNSQNLIEAAKEIKDLLTELDKEYNNDAVKVGIEAVEEIRNNPTLKSRFVNALKEGGTEALNQLIDHPACSIVLAAGKAFIDAE